MLCKYLAFTINYMCRITSRQYYSVFSKNNTCKQYYFDFREINTCDINPVHQLFAAGTAEVPVVFFDALHLDK